MEPIKVYRNRDGGDFGLSREGPHDEEFVVTTRADFDALIAQRDGATARADAASARLARAEAQRDAMNAQYESAMEVIHRNAGARRDGLCGILAWIDRAKEAEALLREARVCLPELAFDLALRIDALLGEATGPDDRKGE